MSEPSATTGKKSNKGWLVGCGIGCVVLLIVGIILIVLVFGWAGKKMDMGTYLNKSTGMFNTAQDEMTASSKTTDMAQKKAEFEKLKASSAADLKELDKTKPPQAAEQLNSSLKEYFNLTGKISTGLVAVFDLLAKVDKVASEFKKINIDNSSYENQASSLRSLKNVLDPVVIEIDSMSVPSEIATTHNSIKTYYKNLSTGLDKAILGSDTKDGAVVSAAKTDMQTALDGISGAFNLESLYKTEIDRATALEKEISGLIGSLSK